MKKCCFLLAFSLLIPVLASCSQDVNPFVVEGKLGITKCIDLKNSDMQNKIESSDGSKDGDSFILYIYSGYSNDGFLDAREKGTTTSDDFTCDACRSDYQDFIMPIIQGNNAVIYSASWTVAKNYVRTSSKYRTAPQFAIFKDGELIDQVSAGYHEEIFMSKESIMEYLGKYVYMPKMLSINYDQLESLLDNNEKKIIYYGWSSCGDCGYLESHYLPEFLLNNKDGAIWYYYDVDEYRATKQTDPEKWNSFVSKVGINLKGNGGKVPTIAYYEGNTLIDAAVYFNDTLEEVGTSYKVIGSYYDNAEIIGNTYPTYADYQKGTEEFHNKKFEAFMEKYYKSL